MTFQKGQSGNPQGRPIGIRDRRVALADRILERGPELVEKLLDNALAGEPLALKLCVERLLPKLRDTSERRPIAIDGETVEAAGRSVLALAAAGELSPDEAATLLTGLGRQAIAEQVGMIADVVARLATKAGVTLPPELEIRTRTPVTITAINQAPSGDSTEKRS